jgi:hypothetical protein
MKKYLNEGFLGLIIGVVAFFYFIFTGLIREKIASDRDLVEIKTRYLRHSFVDNEGFKNFTHQYYIWTENQKLSFQVKADYLRIFKQADFIKAVVQGDTITFTVPKGQLKKSGTDDHYFVTSIESEGNIYLDKDEVLKIERTLAASNADYYIGTMFLFGGLFAYFRRRLRQAKTTANKKFMPAAGDV